MKTKRSSFLLLDANVIIWLFKHGLWDTIVDLCDLHVGRTVIAEAKFFEKDDGAQVTIDLTKYVSTGKISMFEVTSDEVSKFLTGFDISYVERLDPGETEALARLQSMPADTRICSSDRIVFRTLALLRKDAQGISLEELFDSLGRSRNIRWPHNKKFRESASEEGKLDLVQNRGLKI